MIPTRTVAEWRLDAGGTDPCRARGPGAVAGRGERLTRWGLTGPARSAAEGASSSVSGDEEGGSAGRSRPQTVMLPRWWRRVSGSVGPNRPGAVRSGGRGGKRQRASAEMRRAAAQVVTSRLSCDRGCGGGGCPARQGPAGPARSAAEGASVSVSSSSIGREEEGSCSGCRQQTVLQAHTSPAQDENYT